MKDKENMDNWITLQDGEIVLEGDMVGQLVNFDRVWYPVGPALIGRPCSPEYWIKRKKSQ